MPTVKPNRLSSIPKVIVDEVGEIKLSDDLSEFTKLDPMRIPLFLTMTRIGHRFIVDATQEEEASSLSCILFAADSAGNIVQSKKITQGNLHVDSLKDVFPVSGLLRIPEGRLRI